jgi:hypothetical protein
MTDTAPPKLEIDWLKTVGGALAAVSSAVLLSTLGAAGTIIGAALGSVVVTVGGALYSQGLVRSRQRLAQAQTAALRKVGVAQAEVRRAGRNQRGSRTADAHLAHAQSTLDEAKEDLDALSGEPGGPGGPGWRDRLGALPWRRISLVAAGLFAAAVVAITAFELAVGESVSSITGGSQGGGPTIGHIVGNTTDGPSAPGDDVPPADQPSPSGDPADQPSEPVTPSPTPGGEPTEAPSESATPTPEPTAPAESPATTPTAPAPGLAPATTAPPVG